MKFLKSVAQVGVLLLLNPIRLYEIVAIPTYLHLEIGKEISTIDSFHYFEKEKVRKHILFQAAYMFK